MSNVNVTVVETKVFPGQKPGTSGLRKRVDEFMQEHYMENFIQCTLDAMGKDLKGSTLVVGGDGRYGVTEAVDKIIKMSHILFPVINSRIVLLHIDGEFVSHGILLETL